MLGLMQKTLFTEIEELRDPFSPATGILDHSMESTLCERYRRGGDFERFLDIYVNKKNLDGF